MRRGLTDMVVLVRGDCDVYRVLHRRDRWKSLGTEV
jgi:hypothetical protein